jgi:HlyD family secretion protein
MADPQPRKIVHDQSMKKFVTPEQKRQRRVAFIVIGVIIAIAVGGYLLLMPREKTYTLKEWDASSVKRGDLPKIIQASGTVAVPEQIHILSPQEGYAAELLVETGEEVQENQLLAVIDVPDLEDELSDLELGLEDNRKLLAKTRAQNEITNARKRREIIRLEADLADEITSKEQIEKLVEINASRKSELDDQEDKIEELRETIEEAEYQLDEEARLNGLELEILELKVRQLETDIRRLEQQIEEANIKSPMAGEVLALDESLGVPGSLIGKNRELFTIAKTETAIVELEVDEEYAGLLTKDDRVTLDISGTSLTGSIITIGRVAQTSSDGLGATVEVKVKPERVSSAVIPGATAVGKLEVGVLKDILMLQRGPYLSTGSQRYLYVIDGDSARKTAVSFGESEGDFIEVLNGVHEGDEVITSGYQNFIEYSEITLKGDA